VPFRPSDPLGTPAGLDTARPAVRRAFGAALAALAAAHLPPGVPLRRVQFVLRNGHRIPLPGGPGDPDGEFNAIDEDALGQPGADPSLGSSYIQAVAWKAGRACPLARTVLTYSESVNPRSAHHADQTVLFSRRQWLPAYFCGSQVAAHARATTVVRS
jgi:acyl-homoserine-lactone acylase